ncbi:MAG: response regulator [Bdellovibrionota bacterium]|nr:response regulator [Bdellovibrionota bacterium]
MNNDLKTASKNISILIAEDEEGIRDVFEYLLKKMGCIVKLVSDGDEALTAIDDDDFDIILSDVHMPRMSGIELCKKIRMRKNISKPMFFFISGESNLGIDDLDNLDFDGILQKPFSEQDLLDILNKVGT